MNQMIFWVKMRTVDDSEDERTLLNSTDFKLEWYYQQIPTTVEYLNVLATILGGGGGGGGRESAP